MGGTVSSAFSAVWEETFGEGLQLRILLAGARIDEISVLGQLKLLARADGDDGESSEEEEEAGVQRYARRAPWGGLRVTVCHRGSADWAPALRSEGVNAVVLAVGVKDDPGVQRTRICLGHILAEKSLEGVPLLVIANYEDSEDEGMTTVEIVDALGLNSLWDRRWNFQGSTGWDRDALLAGVEWLVAQQQSSGVGSSEPSPSSGRRASGGAAALPEPVLQALAAEGARQYEQRRRTWTAAPSRETSPTTPEKDGHLIARALTLPLQPERKSLDVARRVSIQSASTSSPSSVGSSSVRVRRSTSGSASVGVSGRAMLGAATPCGPEPARPPQLTPGPPVVVRPRYP